MTTTIDNHHPRLTILALALLWSLSSAAQASDWAEAFKMHHLPAYLTAALIIGVIIMLFSNRLYYYRERELRNESRRLNAQLALVLDSNHTQVWTFDIPRRAFSMLSEQGTMGQEYTPIDFQQFYQSDDFAAMRQTLFGVRDGKTLSDSAIVRGPMPKEPGEKQRVYDVNISVLRRDKHNSPCVLLGIQRDITEENKRQEQARNLLLQFHTVFNSSQVDMIYYDGKGVMTDINDKACESFNVPDRSLLLASHSSLKDVPAMQDIDFETIDEMYTSSITRIKQVDNPIGGLDEHEWGQTIYYEQTMNPIHNQEGELTGIVMAGRNITEMVNSYHQQQKDSRLLQQKTQAIINYIDNINYSLKVSQVQLVNYYPESHVLDISNDLNKTLLHLSSLRAMTLLKHEEWRKVKGLFQRMDKYHEGTFTQTVHTVFHDKEGRDLYLNFHMMPIYDGEGRISHYFGVCRNDTEATYTEIRLKEETLKAQETETLKDTFLLNMSYELRTPLNTLIGFAELFSQEHAEEDEAMFAEEIKHSTNDLLQLVNDILFISRLDAHMEEYQMKETDIAILFEGFCYMGMSTLGSGVNVTVENPYTRLVVDIDEQHLGQVVSKLCENAARFTREGTIRCKYEYHHGELAISIEDSGDGIDAETLPHVFERFYRDQSGTTCGTGLDLPIAKTLVEQMGGTIEMQSEKGKGTSAYIVLPCKMTALEKKL